MGKLCHELHAIWILYTKPESVLNVYVKNFFEVCSKACASKIFLIVVLTVRAREENILICLAIVQEVWIQIQLMKNHDNSITVQGHLSSYTFVYLAKDSKLEFLSY